MIGDYRTLVLRDYHKKKIENRLLIQLGVPTPGGLKQLCIDTCSERFSSKDERILKSFFGQGTDPKAVMQAIERFKTDRFKPLANYLKGASNKTSDKNIELLAWLIDFELRPFEYFRKYDVAPDPPANQEPKPQNPLPGIPLTPVEPIQGEEKTEGGTPSTDSSTKRPKWRKIFFVAVTLTLFLSVAALWYWAWNDKPSTTSSADQVGCMYWVDDHYQPIPCNQKVEGVLVVPLDSIRLNHFRKIKNTDSITIDDIGKVWYYKKRDGTLEYYTSSGAHPVNVERRVLRMTDHIFNTYLKRSQ